jgi:hypothetical protein
MKRFPQTLATLLLAPLVALQGVWKEAITKSIEEVTEASKTR